MTRENIHEAREELLFSELLSCEQVLLLFVLFCFVVFVFAFLFLFSLSFMYCTNDIVCASAEYKSPGLKLGYPADIPTHLPAYLPPTYLST